MLLVDREFLGDFVKAFAGLILLIALLFFVDTLIDYFQRMASLGEQGLLLGFTYYITSLPENMVEAFPVASSAAILWVVLQKARTNEILAYLSGGLSPRRLALPLVAGSVLVGILGVLVAEFVVPRTAGIAWRADRLLRGATEQSITQSRNVYQAGAEGRFYMMDAFDYATDVMDNPKIIDVDASTGAPTWMIRAATASLLERRPGELRQWLFTNAVLQRWDSSGELVEHRLAPELWEEDMDRPMEDSLVDFLNMLRREQRMGLLEMSRYIELLESQGKETGVLKAQMHVRLSLPLGAIAIALVLCAHVIRPTSQGVFWGFGGGLAFVVCFYFLFFALKGATEISSQLGPGIGAWATNVLYALLGAVLLWRNAR